MGLSKLSGLYREVILDHGDHPHHKNALPNATHAITLKNPTCGDVINLAIQLMRMIKSKILDLRVRAVPSVKHRPV